MDGNSFRDIYHTGDEFYKDIFYGLPINHNIITDTETKVKNYQPTRNTERVEVSHFLMCMSAIVIYFLAGCGGSFSRFTRGYKFAGMAGFFSAGKVFYS